jgi:hypothetical protein
MVTAERALVWLLRAEAVVLLLALPAVFLPTEWMSAVHVTFGLGGFPRGPLVEYLTRSLSALYASWGPLYLFVSLDVRRYLPLVRFLAVVKGLFGLGMIGLDVGLGMPSLWTATEGPAVLAVCTAQYLLAARVSGKIPDAG